MALKTNFGELSIAVSARVLERDKVASFAFGGDGSIIKPFDTTDLLASAQ